MQSVLQYSMLVVLMIANGVISSQAQFLSTRLPTVVGGDFGNGAATSDVVGGVFVQHGAASARPAVAFGIPTAFGADWRDVYAAMGYQRLFMQAERQNDGAVFTGFGIGNARKSVGVEVTFTVYDLKDTPLRQRSLGLKIHHRLGQHAALAIGMENMIATDGIDGGQSIYGAASHSLHLQESGGLIQSITGTLGIGNGRFNSMQNVRQGENHLGVFGSLAIRLRSWMSVFGTWTGQDLNVGVSFAPWEELPIVFTPTIVNVAGVSESGRRLAGSLGFGFTIQ